MNHWFDQLRSQADRQPWLAVGVGVVGAVVAGAVLWRVVGAARRGMRGRASSVLITIAALMATAVQSAGMWKFFANTMDLPLGLRIFLFSFLEVALLACGTRAKENVRAGEDAGIDGVLVVVLALGSGVLASTDASTWQEVLIRLMVSIVAALLWERDLLATKYAARQEGKKPETIRWRFGWKTLAVRWGWADAGDASLADQGANRVFDQFVRATHAVNRLEPGTKQRRRAADRQATAQARLMSYARLNTDLTQLMRTLGEVATSEGLTMLGVPPSAGDAGEARDTSTAVGEEPEPVVVDEVAKALEDAVAADAADIAEMAIPPIAEDGYRPPPRANGFAPEAFRSAVAVSASSGPRPSSAPVPAPRIAEPWTTSGIDRSTASASGPAPAPAPEAAHAPAPTARDTAFADQVPDLGTQRLARTIVNQWPDGERVTQRAFLAEFRKHRPISNKDGAALHRYAVGTNDNE